MCVGCSVCIAWEGPSERTAQKLEWQKHTPPPEIHTRAHTADWRTLLPLLMSVILRTFTFSLSGFTHIHTHTQTCKQSDSFSLDYKHTRPATGNHVWALTHTHTQTVCPCAFVKRSWMCFNIAPVKLLTIYAVYADMLFRSRVWDLNILTYC